MKREKEAEKMHKSKRQDLVSKKRFDHEPNQLNQGRLQYSEQNHGNFSELVITIFYDGYKGFLCDKLQ